MKETKDLTPEDAKKSELVSWVLNHVEAWEDHRDSNYVEKWDEYYRLWRGIWAESDKLRKSERSRLIAPALTQAIEATVAELEEATFGQGDWIMKVNDDIGDGTPGDIDKFKEMLADDFDLANIPKVIGQTYLYGALFGTGIAKVVVDTMDVPRMTAVENPILGSYATEAKVNTDPRIVIRLEAVHPKNFAIDPAARTIDEALGCAHIVPRPKHSIVDKQLKGIYDDVELGSLDNLSIELNSGESAPRDMSDMVEIIEYHGLVPRDLLPESTPEDRDALEDALKGHEGVDYDEDDLVEAIVTIANRSTFLRGIINPYAAKDRCFIAYQHDTVPDSFYGRGVAEKGYNPQKALDAELRSRIDAMALATNPMLIFNSLMLPRGTDLTLRPGKTFLSNGAPNELASAITLGNINPATFHQSGELERMVQMATGAMDSAAPVGISPRNATASGMSMIQAGMIKRTKRTKNNIDNNFLNPAIRKILWRYMQFAPERYAPADYLFVVKSSMGIMAREYEQQQLTNLIATLPNDSPAFWLVLKGIISNSSITMKSQILQVLDQQLQPDPKQQQVQQNMQEIGMQREVLTNKKLESEVIKNLAQAQADKSKIGTTLFDSQTNRLSAVGQLIKAQTPGAAK